MPHVPGHPPDDEEQQEPSRLDRLRQLAEQPEPSRLDQLRQLAEQPEAPSPEERLKTFERLSTIRGSGVPLDDPTADPIHPGARQALYSTVKGIAQIPSSIPKFISGLRPRRKLPEEEEQAIRDKYRDKYGDKAGNSLLYPEITEAYRQDLFRARTEKDPIQEGALFKVGQKIDDAVGKRLPDQPGYEDSFWLSKVPQGIGSTGGFYAGGLAAGLLRGLLVKGGMTVAGTRAAAGVTTAGLGASVTASGQYEDALAHGADEYTARQSFFQGAGPGVLEALPVMGTISRFTPKGISSVQSVMGRGLREGGTGAVEEAIQEALQTVGGNAIARAHYDQDREWSEGLLEAMAVGAIAGGTFSGASSFINSYVNSAIGEPVLPDDPNRPDYDPWGVLGMRRSAEIEEVATRAQEQIDAMGVAVELDEDGDPVLAGNADPNAVRRLGNILTAVGVIENELMALAEAEAQEAAEQEEADAGETPEEEPAAEAEAEADAEVQPEADEAVAEEAPVEEDVAEEEVAAEPEPLEGRGERVSRTEATITEVTETPAKPGEPITRQEVTKKAFEEEYESGDRVTRNEEGAIIREERPKAKDYATGEKVYFRETTQDVRDTDDRRAQDIPQGVEAVVQETKDEELTVRIEGVGEVNVPAQAISRTSSVIQQEQAGEATDATPEATAPQQLFGRGRDYTLTATGGQRVVEQEADTETGAAATWVPATGKVPAGAVRISEFLPDNKARVRFVDQRGDPQYGIVDLSDLSREPATEAVTEEEAEPVTPTETTDEAVTEGDTEAAELTEQVGELLDQATAGEFEDSGTILETIATAHRAIRSGEPDVAREAIAAAQRRMEGQEGDAEGDRAAEDEAAGEVVAEEGEGTADVQGDREPGAEGRRSAELPHSLRGAKPRYGYRGGNYQVAFANDVSLALYITAQSRPSRRDADYRQFLVGQGYSRADIATKGVEIKERLKQLARSRFDSGEMTGTITLDATPPGELHGVIFEKGPAYQPRPGSDGTALSLQKVQHAERVYGSVNRQFDAASDVIQRGRDLVEVSGPYSDDVRDMLGLLPAPLGDTGFVEWVKRALMQDKLVIGGSSAAYALAAYAVAGPTLSIGLTGAAAATGTAAAGLFGSWVKSKVQERRIARKEAQEETEFEITHPDEALQIAKGAVSAVDRVADSVPLSTEDKAALLEQLRRDETPEDVDADTFLAVVENDLWARAVAGHNPSEFVTAAANLIRRDLHYDARASSDKRLARRRTVADRMVAALIAAEIEADFRELVQQETGHRMTPTEDPLWPAMDLLRGQGDTWSPYFQAHALEFTEADELEASLLGLAEDHGWLDQYRNPERAIESEFQQLEQSAQARIVQLTDITRARLREQVEADEDFLAQVRRQSEERFLQRMFRSSAAEYINQDPERRQSVIEDFTAKAEVVFQFEGPQRTVDPQEWMAAQRETAIAVEVEQRLRELGQTDPELVVRETATFAFGKEALNPKPRGTLYDADPTNPAMRRKLVEGTAKPIHAWVKPVGTTLSSPQDVYRMASEYGRSKTQEIKQWSLLKDGIVQEVIAYTSGSIDALATTQEMLNAISTAIAVTEADEVIMIHNHPSGDPEPSEEDIQVGAMLREGFDRAGLRDVALKSMVLNAGTFTHWDTATGEVTTETIAELATDPAYDVGDSYAKLAAIAKSTSEEGLVVLGLDPNLHHVVTLVLPKGTAVTEAWVKQMAKRYGFKTVAIGTNDRMEWLRVADMVEEAGLVAKANLKGASGYVLDVVYTGEDGTPPRDLRNTKDATDDVPAPTFLAFAEIPVIDAQGILFSDNLYERDDPRQFEEGAPEEPRRSGAHWNQQRQKARDRYNDVVQDARDLYAAAALNAGEVKIRAAKEEYADTVFEATDAFGRDMQEIYREELFERWSGRRQQREQQEQAGQGGRTSGFDPASPEGPYVILGVKQGDDLATIKAAYRTLAIETHPDVSDDPDAHEKFVTVNDAYDTILRQMGVDRDPGALYAPLLVERDTGTEYGDVRKPDEKRDKRDARVQTIYDLMGAFQDVIRDKDMTTDMRDQAIRLLRMGGIPKPAIAALENLEAATNPDEIRRAFTAIRRLYKFQMKRNAKDALQDALAKAKVPGMQKEFIDKLKKVLAGLNLKQVASQRIQDIIGNGETQIRAVPVEDLRGLAETVRRIGQEQAKAKTEQRKSEAEKIKTLSKAIKDEIGTKTLLKGAGVVVNKAKGAYTGTQTRKGRPRRSLLSVFATEFAVRPATILEWLSPTLHRLAYDDISIKAHHRELELLYEWMDPIIRAAEAASDKTIHTRGFEQWRTQVFQVGDVEMTRGEAFQIALSMRDPTNLQLMLRNGITIDQNDQKLKITEDVFDDEGEVIERGTASQIAAIISDGDMEVIATVFNTLQDVKEPLNEAWYAAYLKPVANVVNYVYRKINMRDVESATDPLTEVSQGRDPTTGTWGHLKARMRNPRGSLRIGDMFEGISSHLSHVARITAYIYPAHLAHTVMGRTDVRKAIEGAVGRRGFDRLKESVELQTTRYVDRSKTERAMRKFLRNASTAILGFRPTTWFLNMAGLFITAGYEAGNGNPGFKWLASALPRVMGNWRRITGIETPAWRQRYKEGFMNEITAGLSGESTFHFGPPPLGEVGMRPLILSDELGGVARWLMAEAKLSETMPKLEKGTEEYDRELAYEWMRLLFNGENSSHGGDLTGALALGRRNAFFTTVVMFQSAVSRIYSLAWKAKMSDDATKAAGAATGVMLSLAVATVVRLMFDLADDWEEPEKRDVLRRFLGEAVAPIPIIGGMLMPLVNRVMGEGGPVYPASVAEEFIGDVTETAVQVLATGEAAVTREANAAGEYQVKAEALKLLDKSADVAATLTGLPYQGLRYMAGLATGPDQAKDPIAADAPDVTQEVRRIRRAIRTGDDALFRREVEKWEATKGENMKSTEPLAIINRWLGYLTKYEQGKPARDGLTPSQAQEIDDALTEREELRKLARQMAQRNADILTRRNRSPRPTVTRPQVPRPQRPR